MPRKSKKLSFGRRLAGKIYYLQDRLEENLSRVQHLIQVQEKHYGPGKKKNSAEGDILRAAVVFLHAALEDFLRGLSIVYLPDSSIEALNKIPLLGTGTQRAEKFLLGALFPYKNRKVGKLIELSVAAHLKKTTYNSTSQIDLLLTDCGKSKWPKVEGCYPPIDEMIQRRHRIVHRADSTDKKQKSRQKTTPISPDEVNAWLAAVKKFEEIIVVGIIEAEHMAEHAVLNGHYITFLKALPKKNLDAEIDNYLADATDKLIDTEEAGSAIAETNATGFYVDDYHVNEIEIDEVEKECRIAIEWHATGDANPDKAYCGDEIAGTAVAVLDDNGAIRLEDISATRVDDNDNFDYEINK